jgi:hypothetical protein
MLKDAAASAGVDGRFERRRGHCETDAIMATNAKAGVAGQSGALNGPY